MFWFHEIKNAWLHFAFPHICEGCGQSLRENDQFLCLHCLSTLPLTHFQLYQDNPVEKIFWGRLPLLEAMAQFYFSKGSIIQHLMHQFKYKGHKELGSYLGKLMGHSLLDCPRFLTVEALVPLPLFEARERKRGYNQARILCEGIGSVLNIPVLNDIVKRRGNTDSQTRKGRMERWENMEGRFELMKPQSIEGKHVLLVDDVVTTGATLEACGRALVQAPQLQLSIAALCFSAR